MPTILESLKSVSSYPVPRRTLEEVAARRGIDLTAEADVATLWGKGYRLAVADLCVWLSQAPNVSQGGQSYSFTDKQRADLKGRAAVAYRELAPEECAAMGMVSYGYKGSRL